MMRRLLDLMESLALSAHIIEEATTQLVADYRNSDETICLELYRIDNGLVKDDEIDDADFQEWLREFYHHRVSEKYGEISWRVRNNTLDVWRMITAPRSWRPDDRHLGIYWSWQEDAAEAHWGDLDGQHVKWMIHARVDVDEINWVATLVANASMSFESEMEIQVLPTADPEIVETKIVG